MDLFRAFREELGNPEGVIIETEILRAAELTALAEIRRAENPTSGKSLQALAFIETKAEKARLLNAAHRQLVHGVPRPGAAQALSREFGLSRRQAYRSLEQADRLGGPVPVEEASIPVTIKIPASAVCQLRSYAAKTGLTQGQIVARALREFLSRQRGHD